MKPGTVVDRMRLKISTLETELKRLQLENNILREDRNLLHRELARRIDDAEIERLTGRKAS